MRALGSIRLSKLSTSLAGRACLALAALWLSSAPAFAAPAPPVPALGGTGPVRLAILAEDNLATAGDLLTTELSSRSNVVVLERAEIGRILREQQLSAAGLTAKDYVRVGQLLNADGLLMLDVGREGDRDVLNIRLVAVKQGVVLGLSESPWPVPEPATWGRMVLGPLESLFPKLKVLEKDALPISVLNLRSAVKSPEGDSMEQELTLLLKHRLVGESEVFVLERERMQELSDEAKLPASAESGFWSGAYLVDGMFDKEGLSRATVTLSIRLAPPDKKNIVTLEVTGQRTNLPALADATVSRILTELKRVGPGVDWRPSDEAGQYLDEARWAIRWRLLHEAEAASESVWALGRQTKEVALLRIASYSDEAELKPVIRALQLFCQDTPLLTSKDAKPDLAWFGQGFGSLNSASRMLDRYYGAAETRWGNEDLLAELRAAARATASILKTNVSTVEAAELRRNLVELEWDHAAQWLEKPEDALPLYRDILARHENPRRPPRMAAWQWADRRRLTILLPEFLDELSSSPDPNARLAGLYWNLWRTPITLPEASASAEQALLDAVWEQRQIIYAGQGNAMILPWTLTLLAEKNGTERLAKPRREQLLSFRTRFLKDYLLHATNYDAGTCWTLLVADGYSETDAHELLPAIEEFRHRLPIPEGDLIRFNREILPLLTHFIPQPSPPGSAAASSAAPPPELLPAGLLTASSFVSLGIPVIHPAYQPIVENRPSIHEMLFRHGKLWFEVRQTKELAPANNLAFFVGADPATGARESIPYPEEAGRPDNFFEVTADALYVSAQDHIDMYRFRERKWQPIQAPIHEGVRLTELESHLYATTRDSVFELSPDGQTTRVLASARRLPPQGPLDEVDGYGLYGFPVPFPSPDGSIGLLVLRRLFNYSPAASIWKETVVSPFQPGSYMIQVHPSEEGVVMMDSGPYAFPVVLAIWKDSTKVETLLTQVLSTGFRGRPPPRDLPAPQWIWPQGHNLRDAILLPDGKSLTVLQPNGTDVHDGRQATLMQFEHGTSNALVVPLRFSAGGESPASFALDPNGLVSDPLFLAHTPAGLAVARSGRAGYWLIPKSEFDRHSAEVRKPVLEEAWNRQQAEDEWQKSSLARFDSNHDGALDEAERARMHLNADYLEHERAHIDLNGNGMLDPDELGFFDVNTNGVIEANEHEAINLFQSVLAAALIARFDANHDGVLDKAEFDRFLLDPGAGPGPGPGRFSGPPSLVLPIEFFDLDKNGVFDKAEIARYLTRRFEVTRGTGKYRFALTKQEEPFDLNKDGVLDIAERQAMAAAMRLARSNAPPVRITNNAAFPKP